MIEWRRWLRPVFDAEGLALALREALEEGPAVARPAPLEVGSDGTFERELAPGLLQREVHVWQSTRGDDILVCTSRTFEAAAFTVEGWPNAGRVVVRAEGSRLAAAQAAVSAAIGMSFDEADALEGLAASAAFVFDSSDRRHQKLDEVRYSPLRLAYVVAGDRTAEIERFDRIARERPDLDAAPLCASLVLAGGGHLEAALARLDASRLRPGAHPDLDLARIDVLSRLGRHDEAEAALAALPPLDGDALAHSAAALAVAVHRRAGRPADAAAAALALSRLPMGGSVLAVDRGHARMVAARCLEEAGEPAAVRSLVALEAESVRSLVGRAFITRPAQWFLVEHLTVAWLREALALSELT